MPRAEYASGLPTIQTTERRARKGSIVAIERTSSYTTLNPPSVKHHTRYQLARIVRSSRDGQVEVIELGTYGEIVNVRVQAGYRVFVLDKPTRAADLWDRHAKTEWATTDEMREAVRSFVVEAA